MSIESKVIGRLEYDLRGHIGGTADVREIFATSLALVRQFARNEYAPLRVLVGGNAALLILGTALLVEAVTCLAMSGLAKSKRAEKDVREVWDVVQERAAANAAEIAKADARGETANDPKGADAPSPLIVC